MIKYFLLWLVCLSQFATCLSQPFTSPYRLSVNLDVQLSANATCFLGASYLIGRSRAIPAKETLSALDPNTVNGFDRGATHQYSKAAGLASDAMLYIAIASPLLHLAGKNSRKDFGKVAAISGETLVVNLAITNFVKEIVRRKRPLLYNPEVPLDKKYKADNFKSFFSGHTSTAAAMSFLFAKSFADYNPHSKLKPMVWSLCAAFPLVMGALRFKAGKHYWTDILAGYAVGAICGLAVPYMHSTALKINRQ
jgi:membrane-associated phospholipid phosphatase